MMKQEQTKVKRETLQVAEKKPSQRYQAPRKVSLPDVLTYKMGFSDCKGIVPEAIT